MIKFNTVKTSPNNKVVIVIYYSIFYSLFYIFKSIEIYR